MGQLLVSARVIGARINTIRRRDPGDPATGVIAGALAAFAASGAVITTAAANNASVGGAIDAFAPCGAVADVRVTASATRPLDPVARGVDAAPQVTAEATVALPRFGAAGNIALPAGAVVGGALPAFTSSGASAMTAVAAAVATLLPEHAPGGRSATAHVAGSIAAALAPIGGARALGVLVFGDPGDDIAELVYVRPLAEWTP